MSAPTPFHLAFAVTDIDATREFYVNKLGCKMGRSAERWIDFDFFGHQISAHLVDGALRPAETNPVDGESRSRRDLMRVRRRHDHRSAPPHFFMEHTDRVGGVIVRAERVGTNEFGELVGLVRRRAADRAHLVQHDLYAGPGDLPGRLAAGEAAADDMNE